MTSDKKNIVDALILNDVETFINTHYEFKCNNKYKGFFGVIKARADKEKYEQQDHYSPREFYTVVPKPEGIRSTDIMGSDPSVYDYIREIERKNTELIKKAHIDFLEESFSSTVMKLISAKERKPVDVYKRANIDRRLFSKIQSDKTYMPSKRTAVALAIALELSLDETNDLLKRAGFTLSRSLLFDVIIECFITKGNYDIFEINDVLFMYKQPILGE
jgi:hypothetical protein